MLENLVPDHLGVEKNLKEISPSGFTLMMNLRALTPQVYVTTYPPRWQERYAKQRYALLDPVVRWASDNDGKVRWSAIDPLYSLQSGGEVTTEAAGYGLKFGATVALTNRRSFGQKCALFGARSDRELFDDEVDYLATVLKALAVHLGPHAGLSEAELETLRDLASGMTHVEVAQRRNIAAATVKKRIERARIALRAKNATQAVAIAVTRGLLADD